MNAIFGWLFLFCGKNDTKKGIPHERNGISPLEGWHSYVLLLVNAVCLTADDNSATLHIVAA